MLSQYKIIAALIAVIFVGIGVYSVPEHYREQGRQEVKSEYEKLSQTALNSRLLENAKLAFEYQSKSREIVREYESQLNEQKSDYDNRIATINKSGGLRMQSNCKAVTREADTASTKGTNEGTTTRLPERIESGLYELTRTCQSVETQLTALQKWIIENGLYERNQQSQQ